MDWCNLLIAVVLGGSFLTTTKETGDLLAAMESSRITMVALGVMEEWEVSRFYRYPDRFKTDHELMNERWKLITPDTPPASDVWRLPPQERLWEMRAENVKFREYLEWKIPKIGPLEQRAYRWWLADAEDRLGTIDLMMEIHQQWPTDHGRRLLLELLRKEVGVKRYEQMDWPDHLPLVAYTEPWKEVELTDP